MFSFFWYSLPGRKGLIWLILLAQRNWVFGTKSNIFGTRCCKPLIFQTQIIWSNRIHSLKYLRSTTFGSKDIINRKSEFVAKTQFLCDLVAPLWEKQRNWVFATNSDFLTPISLIFQTMNSVWSNCCSLKYHRFTPSNCKDIGIRTFEFVA